MDVYSLGYVMGHVLRNPDGDLAQLIRACKKEQPDERPGLAELEQQLNQLLFNTPSSTISPRI
jgi:hypothetical protein